MTDNDTGRETIARLADDVLPTLIERLAKSELGELEVREDGWRIRLRRASALNGAQPGATVPSTTAGRPPTPATGGQAAGDGHGPRDLAKGVIKSSAVGYYVARDGIAVGATLRSGDVIGHVDVLGVRQEVVSPIAGVLRALEVEAGQAVEYGQPLGRVEPDVQ